MRLRQGKDKEQVIKVSLKDVPVYEDPFSYFADAVKGRITVPEFGLYSLENNMIVVKILEAARESAKTGKTITLKK
jgi:predicted dehydrogenase